MARPTPHHPLFDRLFRQAVTVDLGTANTLTYTDDGGIVLNQPSVVCFEKDHASGPKRVAAVGTEARQLLGRAPRNLEAVRPMRHGVIANFSAAEHMIRQFVDMARPRQIFSRRAAFTLCVPAGATQVECRAIKEAAVSAGAWKVSLIGESLASVVGAGLPVAEATGSMVVDIGGGTTEVGVLTLGGTAVRDVPAEHMNATGRSVDDGLPRTVQLSNHDIADAIEGPLRQMIGAVKRGLEMAPAELVTDIAHNGIVLTGGGALLGNLERRLTHEIGLEVRVADEPLTCAVRGAGAAAATGLLDEFACE
ncbi:MAG: Rod shape-determining protein MreB [uncultured Paraburkholderia sp.]|nr:MAG: Rod shape-determining protein MreB [uncultured Paraburkholderia sp.]